MRYQCDSCKRTFTHPAKLMEHLGHNNLIIQGEVKVPNAEDFTEAEFSGCPFCKSIAFSEYVEPAGEVESVISVEIAQADNFLKQGYQPKDYFAKTVTLIKLKAKEPEQLGLRLGAEATQQIAEDSFTQQAKKEYAKLEGTQT